MITVETIIEAYLFLRKENNTIPSETIEFMKDCAIEKLKKIILDDVDKLLKDTPKFEELDFGDLIELDCIKYFSRNDGCGVLATATQQSNISLNFSELETIKEKYPWCTHIQWYNK